MAAVRDYPAEWVPEQKIERFLTEEGRRGVDAMDRIDAMDA